MEKGRSQSKILGIVTGPDWLLFVFKISQTSEMAPRYSETAQEQGGRWFLMLLVMSVVSIVLFVMAGAAEKRAARAEGDLVAALRQALGVGGVIPRRAMRRSFPPPRRC